MKILKNIIKGFGLIKSTIEILKSESKKVSFITPFIVIDNEDDLKKIDLMEFSEESIKK